ncbi:MAG: hypothetical protein ABI882_02215 [Acidobacteriota bacterium]
MRIRSLSKTRFLIVASFMLAITVFAQEAGRETPETVIRAFVKAMYGNDAAAFERLSVPDPRRSLLVKGGSVNEVALKEIEEDPDSIQIKIKRDFSYRGKPIVADSKGDYPVGTTVLYMVAHRGGPMMVSLTLRPEGWKFDLRWWLAMVEMSSGKEPQSTTPEFAARALAASLLSMDRKSALRFAMPGSSLDVLFAGAPPYREPSGHLDALVVEMPMVQIGPGEFFEMPSGRLVEGVKREDTKVLIGLMGAVEIPFVVHRVGAEWRVEAEPYFRFLNR